MCLTSLACIQSLISSVIAMLVSNEIALLTSFLDRDKDIEATKRLLCGIWVPKKSTHLIICFSNNKAHIYSSTIINSKQMIYCFEWEFIVKSNRLVVLHPIFGIDGSLGEATIESDGNLNVLIVNDPPRIPKHIENVKYVKLYLMFY